NELSLLNPARLVAVKARVGQLDLGKFFLLYTRVSDHDICLSLLVLSWLLVFILATLFRSSQNKGAIYVFILVSAIERKPSRLAGLLINSEDQKMTIYLNSGRSRQPASW
ncbi:hypothetical protein QQP08_016400, partial [Theobroma cacao]